MSKHTPGPWKATGLDDWLHGPINITPAPNGHVICTMSRHLNMQTRTNARLLAAAPELLDALQFVVDTYGFDASTDSAIWKTANAAIAKAKGKQP